MQACEQLSLFSIVPQAARTAICCMDGECKAAAPAGIQRGHEYYHYTIGPRLYAGTFVGRMQH